MLFLYYISVTLYHNRTIKFNFISLKLLIKNIEIMFTDIFIITIR